ncbi:MAG: iron-containing redox enzyme family protein [Oculatellaceae cyanobacterium bins.114]|nr:iron-containing redox enzyme family protein [Oculatellaceae cyanobacterium bins.114]
MFLTQLQAVIDLQWAEVKKGLFWQHIKQYGVSGQLWQRVLIEIYHYTRHNSINQAVAASRVDPKQHALLAFCYKHAQEELGHEGMVVRDLASIGLNDPEQFNASPLPPTEALIGYLRYVAAELGAIPRLGYSFWAEDSYKHIGPALAIARRDLNLEDENMSFFVAHSDIDAEHSQVVQRIIEHFVTHEQDQNNVIQIARTTLYLTGKILDAVAEAVQENESGSLLMTNSVG